MQDVFLFLQVGITYDSQSMSLDNTFRLYTSQNVLNNFIKYGNYTTKTKRRCSKRMKLKTRKAELALYDEIIDKGNDMFSVTSIEAMRRPPLLALITRKIFPYEYY